LSYKEDIKGYLKIGKGELSGLAVCLLIAFIAFIVTRGTIMDGGPRVLSVELFHDNILFSTLYKVGPIVLSLVGGLVINLSPLNRGSAYASKYLLRMAIVLMGARVTADVLSKASPAGVVVIIVVMTFTIWLSLFLGRRISLERDAAALIGTGNAICGVSACLSVAPAIKARSHTVFAVIGVISLLGLVGVFFVPWAASTIGLSTAQAEVFIGGSLHEIGNVLPAADLYHVAFGGEDVSSLVLAYKMVRVAMLVVVAYILSRAFVEENGNDRSKVSVQGFLVAFVIMAVLTSLLIYFLPEEGEGVRSVIVSISSSLLTVAMAGVGLAMNLKETLRVGRQLLPLAALIWTVQLGLLLVLTLLFV
jgi:uncharacterized integral membrane protein (TIGR00698 family)